MKYLKLVILLALAAAGLSPSLAQENPPLELKQGDHIAILGNGLADRQQHFGWLEAMIYKTHPDKDLVFRNLAVAGDEVDIRLRSENFGSPEEWLKRVKADVVLAFFGFNESFRGQEGLPKFKEALDRFLKETKSANYSGKGSPRVVLVSPTAFENLEDPNFPDGSAHNERLRYYVEAMEETAKANGVPFVNIFQDSWNLYEKHKEPLTINGAHFSESGDRALAPVLYEKLLGAPAPSTDDPALEHIRAAVLDKNWQWHQRYRTVDGYNVYGGRSALAYKPGEGGFISDRNPAPPYVSNYQVMQEEMAVRDVMTANRDKVVHAIAKGADPNTVKPDDSNIPPVRKVETNLPGDQPDGSHTFLSGEEAISKMTLPKGVKCTLFADEKMFPELAKPVQMAWDTKGRLWVAVWPNYPSRTPWSTKGDSLLILEDTDGDYKADKCTTFIDSLNCPTGFQFYKDGVVVMQSPYLVFMRDTDGDDKADTFERVLMGLDAADSHHETNSMCYEPGGAIYCSDGVFHRSQVETIYGPVRNIDGAIYRWEPVTGKFERYMAYGFANPHGRVFDYWGNDIITDATGNNNYFGPASSGFLSEPHKHSGVKDFWDRPSRPCSGTAILSSRAWPEEYRDSFLNLNVISIQGCFRVKVTEDGAGLKGETQEHFFTSSDRNFRPSAISVAPDGSVYFCDWANPIIGHMQHHLRDPNRDAVHGRVYRLTHEDGKLLTPAKIHGEPVPALLELLKTPENNVRERAKVELSKHDSKTVARAAKQWAANLDRDDPDYEHHRLEALWVHQWHNVVDEDLLLQVLNSPEPRARAQAVRVLCYWRDRVSNPLELIKKAAADEHPRVRLEAVRAASFFSGDDVPAAAEAAFTVLSRPMDYWLEYTLKETRRQLAIVSGKTPMPKDPALLKALIDRMSDDELNAAPPVEAVLAARLTRKSTPEEARAAALAELSQRRGTSPLRELLTALSGLGGDAGQVAAALGKLLLQTPAEELKAVRAELAGLLDRASSPAVRQVALAAVLMADGDPLPLWENAALRTSLVKSLPLAPDPALRARFQPLLTEALKNTRDGEFVDATLRVLPVLGLEFAEENFKIAAAALTAGRAPEAAVAALRSLPPASWDKALAGPVVKAILERADKVPAADRTRPVFLEAIQLAGDMAALLSPEEAAPVRAKLKELRVPVFVVHAVQEQLRFDLTRMVVEPGQNVEIILRNTDVMPHNLLVVAPGSRKEIGEAAMAMTAQPDDKGRQYVPRSRKVIAATKMLEPGQSERLTFKAPEREGEYEYVCTFPGHWTVMGGKFIVTKDIDAYLQANPAPPPSGPETPEAH